jgi:hypothetical protein
MELFAFWKYDFFPFIHGDKVTKLGNKGVVETVKCPGYSFQSFRLTNLEEGIELNNQLKELEQQYNIAVLALNNIYKTKVKELGFTELEVSNLKLREH